MAPLSLTIKTVAEDSFPVDIDDEETAEDLAVLAISLRPELGEEDLPKLIHKGKVLKPEQTLKEAGIQSGDFAVAIAKTAPKTSNATQAPAAPAPSPAPQYPAVPAAAPGGDAGSPPEELVIQLCGMGFERPKVIQALEAAFNNPDRAVEYLFSGIPAAAAPAAAAGTGWPVGVLGQQLMTKSGLQPTEQALGGAKVVALYFSAHWCPPCRSFTPGLAGALASNSFPQLAVVFVSSDRDPASFMSYYNEMPWLAVPYESVQRQMLGGTFQVRGIPSLVILDAQTGRQISADGRSDVMNNRFDIAACLRAWGAPSEPVAATPALPAPVAKPEPTKKSGPPPADIDEELAKAALSRVSNAEYEVQETFFKTGLKVLENTLQSPGDPKFRTLKTSNAALQSKLFSVGDGAAKDLFLLAGFEESEDAFSLPGPPDGRCSAVRDKVQAAATAAWEAKARVDRDARIAAELAKDKANPARSAGGNENGRNNIGSDRRRQGGG